MHSEDEANISISVVCPHCGDLFTLPSFIQCEWLGCRDKAEWEGWYGDGLVKKIRVCDEHKNHLRGAAGA